ANGQVDASRVVASLERVGVREGDVLLTGFELGDSAVIAAVSAAQRAGARSIVNPAPARPLPPELLVAHPILTPNALEVFELTGKADGQWAALALHGRTQAPALVTLGDRGAILATDSSSVEEVVAPHVPAVDSTGAGDALNGILAAEL